MRSVHTDEYKATLEILVLIRKGAGITQNQLAKRLRKPQSFVAKYEKGERRIDIAEFLMITRALGQNSVTVLSQILKLCRSRKGHSQTSK